MSGFPGAVWRPGPTGKLGYPSTGSNYTAKEFLVAHSMEGSLAAALGELDRPDREASWTFSNPKTGPLLQHYQAEGVAWASGSIEANKRGVPIEHEGVAGEPLTESQYQNLLALSRWLQRLFGWGLPGRNTWLKEHREMTIFGSPPTACPSGRIPWARLIADLQGGDMGLAEDLAQLRADATGADNDIRARLDKLEALLGVPGDRIGLVDDKVTALRADATGADNDIRLRLDELEQAGGGVGLKRGDSVKLT